MLFFEERFSGQVVNFATSAALKFEKDFVFQLGDGEEAEPLVCAALSFHKKYRLIKTKAQGRLHTAPARFKVKPLFLDSMMVWFSPQLQSGIRLGKPAE